MIQIISLISAILLLSFSALAEDSAVQGHAGCSEHQSAQEPQGSEDYLEASAQEIQLLGKQSFHANIAMIEKALKSKGVNLPENGFITSDFRKALIAFQESVGLPAKGEINQQTLDKLGVEF